jgi:eukaryotic-like serine/threonine-protein kinase
MALGIEPAQPGHDPLLGSVVGGVTILRVIADGGMGRVYEGRQDKPRRAVAVKVMRPGFTSPSLARRFQYEAEVLGRLQHPGIAHIYAAAMHTVAGSEVPYFVMEYVHDAKPLTEYVTDLSLPTRTRLELFRTVCQAVAHGHQKGVIHRDLKPNNILVDGAGQPKVIDFGVARATDSDMALTTMQTDVGQLIGTLQYMSPEQFEADPNNIDIRSDVYALGVILYELLAGQPPYDLKKKALLEVARVVREVDPTPISQLNKTLGRELGVIAGKCLQKDRGHRYSSAAELADELGRHLAGEPITATPPSFWDTVVRLSRRHKIAAAAFTGTLAAFLVAIVGISIYALRADRASAKAEQQQLLAEQAQLHAERARDEALQSRQAETQQRAIAVDESQKARQALYTESLLRLSRAYAENDFALARSLHKAAAHAYGVAYGVQADEPLTLRLFDQLLRPEPLLVLTKPGASISAVAFSSDNSLIATGFDNELPVLWDASTGAMLRQLKPPPTKGGLEGFLASALTCTDRTLAISFAPDGQHITAVSNTGVVHVWSVEQGEHIRSLSLNGALDGVESTAKDQSLEALQALVESTAKDQSLEALQALVESAPKDQSPEALQALSEKMVAGMMSSLTSRASLSRDGTRCVWWAGSGDVSVWDVAEARCVSSFSPPTDADGVASAERSEDERMVDKLVLSADGAQVLLSTRRDVYVFDANNGVPFISLNDMSLTTVSLTPDNTRLVGARSDGQDTTICYWSASHTEPTKTIATIADGSLAVNGMTALSPDGSRLAMAAPQHKGVLLFGVHEQAPVARIKTCNGDIAAIDFSSDGQRFATVHGDQGVYIWDADQDDRPTRLTGHSSGVSCLCFSTSGDRLATGAMDGSIRIWDTATNELLATLMGHQSVVVQLAFSRDGSRLVSRSMEDLGVWDMVSGESLQLGDCLDGAFASEFTPTFSLVATALNGSISLTDAFTSQLVAEVKGQNGGVWNFAYHPSPSRIAIHTSDGNVRIWDPSTNSIISALDCGLDNAASLVFNPSGTLLATASKKGTRLWDVASGACRAALSEIPSTHVAFAPNEAFLVGVESSAAAYGGNGGDTAGDVAVWDVATGARLADSVIDRSPLARASAGMKATAQLNTYLPLDSIGLAERVAANDVTGAQSLTRRLNAAMHARHYLTRGIGAFAPDSQLVACGKAGELGMMYVPRGDVLTNLTEPGLPTDVAFHPGGLSLAVCSISSPEVQVYGISCEELRTRRLAARDAGVRLTPLVNTWLEQGAAVAMERLALAKDAMPPQDCREAANLVLKMLSGRHSTPQRVFPLKAPQLKAAGESPSAELRKSLQDSSSAQSATSAAPSPSASSASASRRSATVVKPGIEMLLERPAKEDTSSHCPLTKQPLARFMFTQGLNNKGTGFAIWDVYNTPSDSQGLFLDGTYDHGITRGFRAVCKIPAMNYNTFTIAIRVRPHLPNEHNVILVGGTGYRWLELGCDRRGGLRVSTNNGRQHYPVQGVQLKAEEWVTIVCSLDKAQRTVLVSVDGSVASRIELSPDFAWEVEKADESTQAQDRVWTFTNYANGMAFRGQVNAFEFYDTALSAGELRGLPVMPGQEIDGENAQSGDPSAVAVGVGEIRGTCMLNGHPFLTSDTPVLSSLSWLEDGKQKAIKDARFTYDSATGKYSLAGLPPENSFLLWLYFRRHPKDTLHLGGQHLFSAYHIDLQGRTDADRADFPLLVEQVIHLKKPVDNNGILEKTEEGLHPELSSPVTFEWEPVEGADTYEVEVSTWCHKGHPTGARPAPITQKTSEASASFSLDATKDKEWYRVNIKAFDQGRQVAELMKVSPGSYGEWIDFVVRP